MKRLIAVLVVTGISFLGPQATAGHPHPALNHRAKVECRYNQGANNVTNREVQRTIRCAVHKWHVAGGASKALSVARCESGFNEHARYASGCGGSGCGGVYQQHLGYWPGRVRSHRGLIRRFNLHTPGRNQGVYNYRTNVLISIRMASHSWRGWACA